MSDSDGMFIELQQEFLAEASFLVEQYEESMLGLESNSEPVAELSQIFRVAHSIKGGASAVGLNDLCQFSHAVEDLLSLLRVAPVLVNSKVISLLLASGDALRFRIDQLRSGDSSAWDTSALIIDLKQMTIEFNKIVGVANDRSESETQNENQEDHANYDLLKELEEKFGSADQKEYKFIEPRSEANVSMDKSPSAEIQKMPELASATSVPEALPKEDVAAEEKLLEKVESAPVVVVLAPNVTSTEVKDVSVAAKVAPNRQKPNAGSSIKVDTQRVDAVLDAVGELVVLKNQLLHDESIRVNGSARVASVVDQIDKTVRELYDRTLSIRMTPLKSLFVKIQRIVRDVSLQLEKPVDLELVGEDTEVERTVFELLGDPMVHMIRNAMDHGIEKPAIRKEKGKNPVAKLRVSAQQTGGSVSIEITDDGGGIHKERVFKKALEKGIIPAGTEMSSLSEDQIFQFLFAPGFSTAEKVSDLSGRGVGLDVVKSNLEKIHGKIDIRSKIDQGTTFRLSIPLSTAITDGIVVAIAGSRFIVPIHTIREIVRAMPSDFTDVSGAGHVVRIRENLLPVVDISTTLAEINWDQLEQSKHISAINAQSLRKQRNESMLLIVESLHGEVLLPVDDVIGQAQVVVKPVPGMKSIPEISGAAILGDGRTVLVIDPASLVFQSSKITELTKDVAA